MEHERKRFNLSLIISVWTHIILILVLFLIGGKYYLVFHPDKNEPVELEVSVDNGSDNQSGSSKNENENSDRTSKDLNSKDFKKQFGVGKEWNDLVDSLVDTSNLRKNFPQVYDDVNYNSNVKHSYMFRKRHYEDLVVKEVFPTLKNVDKPFEQILNEAATDLNKYNQRNEIIKKFRKWSKGELSENRSTVYLNKKGQSENQRPLEFPKEEREKYFDSTLKETKEDQLYGFIQKYFNYDPNKGDLPIAVRDLYYDNLQRMVFTFSPDPTYLYIDYFDENLNKEDFLKNSLYQASRLKKTKTQTELLFAIENIYEIQQRAWQHFFNFESLYQNLPDDKKKHLRVETLKRIKDRYKPLLKEKKISNYNDAIRIYSKKREEIIDYILSHTPQGYRRLDAEFEKGRIHWEMGIQLGDENEKKKAISIWKNIDTNIKVKDGELTNLKTMEKIKPLIQTYERFKNTSLVERQIQMIIDQRQSERLMKKIKREEKILWPK